MARSEYAAMEKQGQRKMERSEYATMEKQVQHKLRRDSAEVHEECKSVLVYLIANKQARKISNAGIIAWKYQTGSWRSQESRLSITGVPKS
jgi:hypothetical protein